jgi:putative transcriptional regulator
VKKGTTIAIPADPEDPEDFDVSIAALKRGLMGRRVRQLRNRLGMTQQEFARVFGIPANSIRQYEIGRYMPPPAVRAYLRVIEAEPDMVLRVMAQPVREPAMS